MLLISPTDRLVAFHLDLQWHNARDIALMYMHNIIKSYGMNRISDEHWTEYSHKNFNWNLYHAHPWHSYTVTEDTHARTRARRTRALLNLLHLLGPSVVEPRTKLSGARWATYWNGRPSGSWNILTIILMVVFLRWPFVSRNPQVPCSYRVKKPI